MAPSDHLARPWAPTFTAGERRASAQWKRGRNCVMRIDKEGDNELV